MHMINKLFFVSLLPVTLSFPLLQSAQAATSSTTAFTATIVGGACDISAPPTVSVNSGTAIASEDIAAGTGPEAPFNLTLSGCKGYGLVPSITLEGDVTDTSGMPLFLSNTSTTKGYGILLTTAGNTNFKMNDNLAANMKITAENKTWATTMASSLDGTIPVIASVSCGNCAADADIQGGELKASVSFKFEYN